MADKFLYEFLIRGDGNGIKGCHVVYNTPIVDSGTGEVLMVKEGQAEPVTVGDVLLESIVGEMVTAQQVTIDSLTAELNALKAKEGIVEVEVEEVPADEG